MKVITIALLLSFLSVGCNIKSLEGEKKLPKSEDKLLYITLAKYCNPGKSINGGEILIFKPEEEQEIVNNIFKAFKGKEPIDNISEGDPEYEIMFLYNLDPKPKEVREEFLESDRFEITYKNGLFVQNKETKEVFKIEGENSNKVIEYLKLIK